MEPNIPQFDFFMNPVIDALKALGGSGTIEEIDNKVAELENLSDEQLEVLHDADKGSRTAIEYRLAWVRTYLKKYGILENSSRSIWVLTSKGNKTDKVDPTTVKRYVHDQNRKAQKSSIVTEDEVDEDSESKVTWRDELLETLLEMDPSAFERLVQRILRESGFIQVEVTGKSSDSGIDGKGIMRFGGITEFSRYLPM